MCVRVRCVRLTQKSRRGFLKSIFLIARDCSDHFSRLWSRQGADEQDTLFKIPLMENGGFITFRPSPLQNQPPAVKTALKYLKATYRLFNDCLLLK